MDEPVRVLSTLALKGAVSHLAGHYVAAGGARIEADFAPTLALLDRLRAGEAADVVILTREGLDEVVREGRVTAASCVDLARSYVGLAVRAGEPHPDISTEPALRAALLGARAADATICPSEAARAVGGDDWRHLMEPARSAARRLVATGDVEITQGGHVVDPSTAKGPIRVRLVRSVAEPERVRRR